MDRRLAPPRRRWPIWLGAGIITVAVGAMLVGPSLGRWSSADHSEDRQRLRFADARRGDLVYDIAVQGRVVAAARPTLFSPAAGLVSLRVREGETVATGDTLAMLESPELKSRLGQERATLAALRSDYGREQLSVRKRKLEAKQDAALNEVRVQAAERALERNERLRKLGIGNDIDLEAARDELQVASLELDHSRKTLALDGEMLDYGLKDAGLRLERQELVVAEVERQVGDLTITAPFDGLVATLSVADRDAVVGGQPLVGIVDLGALEVDVAIPESYADDIGPGVAAVIAIGQEKHPGVLTRVAPEIRNNQVTGRVAFTSGTPAGLRQNQRVSTRLVLENRAAVVKLPRGPWLEGGGGRWLYVVEDSMAHRREVEVGVVSVTEVEVVRGLDPGASVVLSDLARFDGAATILLRN